MDSPRPGNQGLSDTQQMRPIRLPLNAMECGSNFYARAVVVRRAGGRPLAAVAIRTYAAVRGIQ